MPKHLHLLVFQLNSPIHRSLWGKEKTKCRYNAPLVTVVLTLKNSTTSNATMTAPTEETSDEPNKNKTKLQNLE